MKANFKNCVDGALARVKTVFNKKRLKCLCADIKKNSVSVIKYTIEHAKTKDERTELTCKAKESVAKVYRRIIAKWESGIKGKIVVAVSILLVVCVALRVVCGGSSSSKERSAGLQREQDIDALFYDSDEKFMVDETLGAWHIVAKPNLYKLPLWIKTQPLITAVYPNYEKEAGDAFPVYEGGLDVVNVGSGYVIARRYDTFNSENYYAYIRTDDEYVDNQALKRGFYAYEGIESRELTNGSSVAMPAFRKLDDAYFKAVEWNSRAEEAAEEENRRRREECLSKQDKVAQDVAVKETLKIAQEINQEVLGQFVHVPKVFQDCAKVQIELYWRWTNDTYIAEAKRFLAHEEFLSRVKKGDLPSFLANADRYDTPEKIKTVIYDDYLKYRFVVKVSPDVKVDLFIVNPRTGVKTFSLEYDKDTFYNFGTYIYVVDKFKEYDGPIESDDNELVVQKPTDDRVFWEMARDGNAAGFIDAYEKRYGE